MFDPKHEEKSHARVIDQHVSVTLTPEQARLILNGEPVEEFDNALYNAQGQVFSGASGVVFLIIKIEA